MKKINKFQADDGRVFNSEEECKAYEEVLVKVNIIMQSINPIPDDTDFANGGGYIQQDAVMVESAKKQIKEIGNKMFNSDASFYWLGRYFDDSDYMCLYRAWGRLTNIDNQYREWGQGYYAAHPDKGKQIKLN